MSTVDPRVRPWLVCPSCRGELEDVPDGLRCPAEGLRYPVVDGVPHLIPERVTRERTDRS